MENSKALQKTREDKLQLEADLAIERAEAEAKRSLLLMLLSACLVVGTGIAVAFAAYQKHVAQENGRLKTLAESADLAKSQFLAVMSHELRTPLNGIIGLADMLSREGPTQDVKFKNGVILKSGLSLLDLLSDVLDMSHVETGKMKIVPTPLKVRELISSLADLWTPQATAKNLTMTTHVDDSVPQILSIDPMRLRQCLENLLSNGIKFTAEGRVHLHVTYADPVKGNNKGKPILSIIVADTGKGMSPDESARIFDPFTQADTSITREFGGSGLGLAITRSLARLMGGDVVVKSAKQRGSEFILTLQTHEVDATSINPEALNTAPLASSPKENIINANKNTQSLKARKSSPNPPVQMPEQDKVNAPQPAGENVTQQETQAERRAIMDAAQRAAPMQAQMHTPIHNGALPQAVIAQTTAPVLHRQTVLAADQTSPAPVSGPPPFSQALPQQTPPPVEASQTDLPAAQSQSQTISKQVSVLDAAKQSGEFEGLKVLVVDDIESNHAVVNIFLEPAGCVIRSAMNGQDAITAVGQETFDLILMDVRMPIMDGITAMKVIRAMDTPARHIPIVAMTADNSESNKAQCMAAGAAGFLSKPIMASELFDGLRHIIRPLNQGQASQTVVTVKSTETLRVNRSKKSVGRLH